ncbi:hypothetical protein N8Y61_01515, partial [Akkermansiaceae bacterium]|nr:hypothetical protein [Akkermansiaceae bacterium]
MTTRFLTGFIAVAGTITLFPVQAAPIAGCDFANGAAFDSTTDDLLAADGISVSNWSTAGGGAITGDGNGNADRFSAPVGKFNGPTTTGTPPAVGSAPPTLGIHSFTISISAGTT